MAGIIPAGGPVPGPAERRQVTALSYDLVDSTRLAVQMDPEDLRALQRLFHEACSDAILQYDGYVGRYVGDGAMAYFGYPRAHEDDPERAIRAGLGIIDNCRALNERGQLPGGRISLRVGVATGLVVAGDFRGDRAFDQDDVVGIAPNLAYKIQASAPPGTLVVSGVTRELTAGLFQCRARPPLVISGFDKPQPTWQVLRARGRRTRSWSARLPGLTPLVSRDEEVAILTRRWALAQSGEGQVALISGEPGIGKSRIAAAIKDRIAADRHLTVILQCSSQESDTAFHPVARLLEQIVGPLAPAPDVMASRLAELTGSDADAFADIAPYLAQLADRSGRTATQFRGVAPEKLKQLTLQAIVTLIERTSLRQPMLLVCEDIHWIDPTSEELFSLVVEHIKAMRVLVLATFRPSYQARWVGLPHVTLLSLNRLAGRHAGALVSFMAAGRLVSQKLIGRIVELADGVPLFLEELSRAAFTEAEISGAAEPAIPVTLTDSLTARIDQLGAGRELVQVCSVIGRSFDTTLVCKLAGCDEAAAEAALERMVELGLAHVRGRAIQAVYSFRHSLIQESAYRSMLRPNRQAVHRKLAEILAADHAGESDASPEILAYHYEQAGAAGEAIQQLHLAAKNAVLASANIEAVRLLDRALRLLITLPGNAERDLLELSLLVSLGSPRLSISGPGAPEVQDLYRRAVELCDGLPKSADHFAAHWGWWFTARDNREALDRANRLSELAAELGDDALVMQAHHCQWAIQYCVGDHRRTLEHVEKGLAIYERGDFRHHSALYGGHDPKCCGLGERAFSLWLTGAYESSLAAIEQAVAHALALDHAGSIRHCRDQQIMLFRFHGDAAKVLTLAEETARYAEEHGFKGLAAQTKVFRAWAAVMLDDPRSGLDELTAGLAEHIEINTPEDLPMYYEMVAEAYGAKGEPESGLPLLDEAIAVAHRSALEMWTAELHRRKGVLLMQIAPQNRAQAKACFAEAIGVATGQGARALLLRALCDDLQIAAPAERPAALAALSALCAALTEGQDYTDVTAARRLLKQSAG